MSASSDRYFYGVENGEIMGPLALDAIAGRIERGEIPQWIVLSRTSGGPWSSFERVLNLGDQAFAPASLSGSTGKPKAPKATVHAPGSKNAGLRSEVSAGPFLRVIGLAVAILSLFAIGMQVSMFFSDNPKIHLPTIQELSGSVGGIVS